MKDQKTRQELLEGITGFGRLSETERTFISGLSERLRLSMQQMRIITEAAVDLQIWEEPPLHKSWDESDTEHLKGKDRSRKLLERLREQMRVLRERPTRYEDFKPPRLDSGRTISIEQTHPEDTILGRCPVAGEKTRCCNLQTLDAVKQCGFACSYCSIQSFYDEDRVYFQPDLSERLAALEIDDQEIYHIGTGQSSDSLMWGDQNGLLNDLFTFASAHPNVILELKTKAARTDWLGLPGIPKNVVATWSLNPPTIITNEEHLTATLDARLHAARKAADAGLLIGFHFHPMVWYDRWEEDYGRLFSRIVQEFSAEEILMISFGTLTFIRPVIRQLRDSGRNTRITEIPMTDAAGKYSYPIEVKQQLFSFAYEHFPEAWKEQVFFYLCMEDPSLWEPVFGYSYRDNDEFEQHMKRHYMKRVTEHKKCFQRKEL